MKNIIAIFSLLILTACSGPANKLEGKWKLEEMDYSAYYAELSEEVRMMLEGKMQEEFERIKGKTFFHFSPDNQLTLEVPNYSGEMTKTEGKWNLNEGGDSLYFDLSDPESFKIITLNETTLVLSTEDTPKRSMHLSKVK